jgi:uncharacterized protein YecE (DUF72 family)
MTRYFVGTAGWSYLDWEGIVYPGRKSRGFHALVFLAEYLNLVEVNSTFYRPPVMQMTLSWVKRIQHFRDFLFAVKLHRDFTHGERRVSPKAADDFKRGIEPIRAHDRLAAILVQFPWSFKATPPNQAFLDELFRAFAGYPLALEIRHGSWNRGDFFQWLRARDVGFCNIDQPVINNSLEPTAVRTHHDFSYVRLHGRNVKNWFRPDAGRDARYNYLYPEHELDEWVERIQSLGRDSGKVFVITNNHYRGQAMANALQIKNKLTGEKVDVPLDLIKAYPLLKDIVKRIEKGQMDLFEP